MSGWDGEAWNVQWVSFDNRKDGEKFIQTPENVRKGEVLKNLGDYKTCIPDTV